MSEISEQHPPKRIYLQRYYDYDDDMVTWCRYKINEDDIEYILQSEYDTLRTENERLKTALREITDYYDANQAYSEAYRIARKALEEE